MVSPTNDTKSRNIPTDRCLGEVLNLLRKEGPGILKQFSPKGVEVLVEVGPRPYWLKFLS